MKRKRALPSPLLIDTTEAATLLGVDPKTIRAMVRAGTLQPVRLIAGGHPKYRRADILELAAAGGTSDSGSTVSTA